MVAQNGCKLGTEGVTVLPCQENRNSPPEAPLHPREWPHKPWIRLNLDYAGPFLGKMFLIVMDAHSKWIEAFPMNTSTSSATIKK